MNNKDRFIFLKIISYCEQIQQARSLLGDSLDQFLANTIYQNACCMCILQIGELAGKLSEEARGETPEIPWKQIRGMRNICAHNYGEIDPVSTWATIQKDIPALKINCEAMLSRTD